MMQLDGQLDGRSLFDSSPDPSVVIGGGPSHGRRSRQPAGDSSPLSTAGEGGAIRRAGGAAPPAHRLAGGAAPPAHRRTASAARAALSDEEVVRLKQDGDAAEAALRRLIEERSREEEVFKEQVKAATGEQLDALLASHMQQSQARQAEYDAALAVRDGKVRKAALAEQLLMAERDSLAKRVRAAATEERLRDELHECEVAARAEADCRARFLAA